MSIRTPTRTQALLDYLVFTAAIATGLSLFSSASNILGLLRTASNGLFLPLLLTLVVTFLLDPLVNLFEGEKISRTTSIFIVYLLLAGIGTLLVSLILPHGMETWLALKQDLPRYTARFTSLLSDFQTRLHQLAPFVDGYDLPAKGRALAERFVAELLLQTPRSAMTLGSLLILVPLFTFFFLRDGQRMLRLGVALTPNRHFEMVHDLSYLISRQLSQFIRGRIIEAIIVGLVVTAGLACTDIRYAPLLGAIAGIANLIPYVGPIIGMIPGILIALVDLGIGGEFWWILTVYILIAQVIVDSFILIPIFISRVSNLHPLWVILAILMGGKLSGVIGMIIGVPVASIIKMTLIEIRHYRATFSLPDGGDERG
ncbi:MAG: AI-2E family transporter [Desulfuromonas sp.]|nr:MAG: AI-2E family transporter [Desulfuromonas sp.]